MVSFIIEDDLNPLWMPGDISLCWNEARCSAIHTLVVIEIFNDIWAVIQYSDRNYTEIARIKSLRRMPA